MSTGLKAPEEQARENIDRQLTEAGWLIQDRKAMNLSAGTGVAVREMNVSTGFSDYLLYLNRKPVGVIEAKKEGTTLSGVTLQSDRYIEGIRKRFPSLTHDPRFTYESTGVETFFRDLADPFPRQRRVFCFHQPQTLQDWLKQGSSLRERLIQFPPLVTTGLYACQTEAITNLEQSFAQSRPRALIQMATGSGKTFTAVTAIYRLIEYVKAKRVLFLVDRRNLGLQALREFQQYETATGRKFTDLYNVQLLSGKTLDKVSKVCIATIQRLYSILREEDLDPEIEDHSLFEGEFDPTPRTVAYKPAVPIESFDMIVIDECHRSIYTVWKQVLEYFDAFLIGLTATPSKQTIGFFDQNLVMEYTHEKAVADKVNVGYGVYRIQTHITAEGSTIEAGLYVDHRLKGTREMRSVQLDEDLTYTGRELDQSVVAIDQIRTIIKTFKAKLFTEIFPERSPAVLGKDSEVPKTLIFAKDDSHAEDIVRIVLEEFNREQQFCQKITYKSNRKPEDLIADFRNNYYPRIAVTVDMIATGTDVKPIECLLFMRDVRSSGYFEQMKGRGTRVIALADLQKVTPGNVVKTHFVIVDASGVCDSVKTEMSSIERCPSIPLEKLLQQAADGIDADDLLLTLMGRLSRLDHRCQEVDQARITAIAGKPLRTILQELAAATDRDVPEAEKATAKGIACRNFDNPQLRQLLLEIQARTFAAYQVIDYASPDMVQEAQWVDRVAEHSPQIVASFKAFIAQHKDEITALQILLNQPYHKQKVTYQQIKELADAIRGISRTPTPGGRVFETPGVFSYLN
ncbi:MAG: DEAD/DEAH box helicase family protein [Candidatus Vecturithrix sp.]|jgi:type I restriction enzyme R subunit|nr:DEAD/DEAH box helicase family protein [Candidatus Vecturithrix sp.]